MQLDIKRDGKYQSEAFGGKWFLLFQNDALPESQGDLWYDDKAKPLPGVVYLPSRAVRSRTPSSGQ